MGKKTTSTKQKQSKKQPQKKTKARTKTKRATKSCQTIVDITTFGAFAGSHRQENSLPLFGDNVSNVQMSDADRAQELIYEAWEAPTRKRAVGLAKRALKISPDCADAYILLAEEDTHTLREEVDLFRKALEAGERKLGRKAFTADVGYFWGLIETRPYMRARAKLAQSLWLIGRRPESVKHYFELLRLNPNDNQGNRYLLMPALIELGQDADAEKLYLQYKEDFSASWAYSRVLLDFRLRGDSATANRALRKAISVNKYVPSFLLDHKLLSAEIPDRYGPGDVDEAVVYTFENVTAWIASGGAMDWLATKVEVK